MIVLPHLGKLSLQICPRINRLRKNKIPYCNFRIVFHTQCKLNNFLTFKDKITAFLRSGIIYKFKSGGCMLPILAKLSAISKSECVNNLEFLLLPERERKGITIQPQKNIIYFAIIHLILTIFPYSPATTMKLKYLNRESFNQQRLLSFE